MYHCMIHTLNILLLYLVCPLFLLLHTHTHIHTGWRPGRTIFLCSWDAEEYSLVGSTEWVEVSSQFYLPPCRHSLLHLASCMCIKPCSCISVGHFTFVHLHTCGQQDRAKLLGASTVAYLNVDTGVSGEYVIHVYSVWAQE